MSEFAESRQRLWMVPGPLVVWAAHFTVSYITAALWCGRMVARTGSLSSARAAIGVYTLVSLAVIVWIGWLGYRAHGHGGEPPPHDADSPQDRHRFIGLAALLVAGLAAVAVLYSAVAVSLVETCE